MTFAMSLYPLASTSDVLDFCCLHYTPIICHATFTTTTTATNDDETWHDGWFSQRKLAAVGFVLLLWLKIQHKRLAIEKKLIIYSFEHQSVPMYWQIAFKEPWKVSQVKEEKAKEVLICLMLWKTFRLNLDLCTCILYKASASSPLLCHHHTPSVVA